MKAGTYCYKFEFNSDLTELSFIISIDDNLMLDIIEHCKLGIKDCIEQIFEDMHHRNEFDYKFCSYEELLNRDDEFYTSTYPSDVFTSFERIETDFFILTLDYKKNVVLINDTLKTSLTKIIITFDIKTKNTNVSFYNGKFSQLIYSYDIYLDIDLLKFYKWTYNRSIPVGETLEPYLNMFDYYIFDNIKLIELTDTDII